MTTKFGYSLHGVRRTSNEKHVLLKADDRGQSLAENRMILYAQDANGLGLNHLHASLCRFRAALGFPYSTHQFRLVEIRRAAPYPSQSFDGFECFPRN